MPDDEESKAVQYKEVKGAYGTVIIISCAHCMPLIDEALEQISKEKIH